MSITATSGSIAGDFQIGTSGVFRSGATAYGTGTGIWMDHNGGTPRFRVGDPAGNRLTWDGTTLSVVGNGTFSGTVNASGGAFTGSVSVGSGAFTAGNATLSSSGISLSAGDSSSSSISWTDGSYIRSYTSGTVRINAATELGIISSSSLWKLTNTELFHTGDASIGTSGDPFGNAYLDGATIRLAGIGADTGTALVRNASNLVKTDSSSIRYKRNIRRWQPRF